MTELSKCQIPKKELFNFDFGIFFPSSGKASVQAPVVQTSDSAIHRINHYPVESVIDFHNTYPLESDLSGG